MKRTEHGKIVRDRIPELIEAGGQRAVWHEVGTEKAICGLENKLGEELKEYLADHSLEELADLVEVVHGILYHRGVEWAQLERIRLKKRADRGGFDRGIYLEATEEE